MSLSSSSSLQKPPEATYCRNNKKITENKKNNNRKSELAKSTVKTIAIEKKKKNEKEKRKRKTKQQILEKQKKCYLSLGQANSDRENHQLKIPIGTMISSSGATRNINSIW